MTGDQYQAEFDTQRGLGRMPIYVQGGGAGANTRYAAMFAVQDQPIARQWTQVNASGAGFAGIHQVLKTFMQTHGVRAGVLSIRKNGVARLSSGYTWDVPGATVTQPASLLRLASVSKAFTCAAVKALADDPAVKLDLNRAVFPLLGITSVALPAQTRNPLVDTITIQQCIDHQGGWQRNVSGFDPVFQGRAIATSLGLTGHVTKRDVARYMYGEPLQFNPGAGPADVNQRYSNFGYVLLALVVERVSGLSFQDYLKQHVLNTLGVAGDVWTGATLRSGRRAGELSYDAAAVGASAWTPTSTVLVPSCYGTFLIAEMDGGGGLVATAPAVTAFINRNAVWGVGGRAAGLARAGEMPGTRSFAESRGDGIDWCYILNTSEVGATPTAHTAVLDQLTTDLDTAIGNAGL
jgi:CubicO group peptidase (beta-lactamase class C family)